MRKLSTKAFDFQAERSYYSNPPTTVSDFNYLEPYYRALLGNYHSYFTDKSILDIGAGECLHGYFISTVCNPKSYVNLDLFKDRIEIAYKKNPFNQMQFAVGDCFSLPFNNASFDVVWGNGILFRLRPLERVVSEINRVLVTNGFYLGIEPNLLNPALLFKFMSLRRQNRNDGILTHRKVKEIFLGSGLNLELKFFWRRLPLLKNPFLSVSMGLIARKIS